MVVSADWLRQWAARESLIAHFETREHASPDEVAADTAVSVGDRLWIFIRLLLDRHGRRALAGFAGWCAAKALECAGRAAGFDTTRDRHRLAESARTHAAEARSAAVAVRCTDDGAVAAVEAMQAVDGCANAASVSAALYAIAIMRRSEPIAEAAFKRSLDEALAELAMRASTADGGVAVLAWDPDLAKRLATKAHQDADSVRHLVAGAPDPLPLWGDQVADQLEAAGGEIERLRMQLELEIERLRAELARRTT